MKLRYADYQEIEDNWEGSIGHDIFVDEYGNQYVLTAKWGLPYGYRVTDEEANALATELGVK